MHFLVISLINSSRRPHVTKQMNHFGFNFKFIDGVNIKNTPVNYNIDNDLAIKHCGHQLTAGEIGCALSHIKCYEYIIENNIDECIILEDDFQLCDDFLQVIANIVQAAPSRKEMIFLHHGKAKFWPLSRKITSTYKLVRYRYPSYSSKRAILSALGYLITHQGAKKLLSMAYPVRMPADYLTGYIQHNKINAYGIEPCCVWPAGFTSEIDSIEQRNYGTHIEKRANKEKQ